MASSSDHHSSERLSDVENPPDNASSVSPATTTSPSTSTALSDNNDGEIRGAAANPEATTDSTSSRISNAYSTFYSEIKTRATFIFLFLFMFLHPFIVYGRHWFKVFKRWCHLFRTRHNWSGQRRPVRSTTGGIYSKQFKSNRTATEVIVGTTTCITINVAFVLLVWLGVSLHLGSMKNATFLGVIHWKWSLLAILLSLGYPYISVLVLGYINLFTVTYKVVNPVNAGWYILKGLRHSIASFLYFLSVFLIWMLYFPLRESVASRSPGVDKYITRTLAMVVVGAFLWVLKSMVLLRRKANAIYKRFKGRVLMAAFRLFFLNLILEGKEYPGLLPWRFEYSISEQKWIEVVSTEPEEENVDDDAPSPVRTEENVGDDTRDSVTFRSTFRRNIQDRIKLSPVVPFQTVKYITRSLMNLAKDPLSEDEDKQISDILHVYRQKTGYKRHLTEDDILPLVESEEAADLLKEELKAEYPSKKIDEIPFENWLVDAHKSCVALGHTLIDVFAMTRVLDLILSWCLIIAIFLLWLLLTELATIKVLVVIGSPFLAFTFVFGDTCKTFFQGFIFAFVTHPFNIGDRCVIDGVEVEVKHINIMTTTCLKVGTKEKMVNPNSGLATKLIINLEGKLDTSDVIQVILQASTEACQILQLQNKIKTFVCAPDQKEFFEPSCRVVVKEMRDGIKIITYFQHTVDGQDVSHSQFLEKKETQRSILFMHIKETLDELDVQVATPHAVACFTPLSNI